MKRWQVVAKVALDTGVTKETAKLAVDSVFDAISESLGRGEMVVITGFGSFRAKDRASRVARDPRTGEQMVIAARRVATFKPSKALREAVAS